MSSEGRVDPGLESFSDEMDRVEQVFREKNSPLEWVSEAKEILIDDYIYSEVLEGQNSNVVEPLKVDLIGQDHSDEEIREAVNGDVGPEAVLETINSYNFYEQQERRREREELADPGQGEVLDFEEALKATKESLVWDSVDSPEDSPDGSEVDFRDVNGRMADAVVESAVSDEELPSDPEASDASLSDREVLEAVDEKIIRDDREMLEAIKEGAPYSEGEFYERVLQLGVDLHNKTEEEAFDGSIFDDRVDASDGFGMDYVLRGGKRLRPAMTLFTEYALEGEISHKGMLVGAAQEIIHASSLAQDDEMDGDPIRRLKLTTERINNALFDGEGYDQSMLDGNKVEAWGNKAVLAAVGQGVPQGSAQEAHTIEADLQDGQKRDIDMEDRELREADLEDYEQMIDGKTGAMYSGGVEIMVEDHLENVEYGEKEEFDIEDFIEDPEDSDLGANEAVQREFMNYMDQFNKLFQAGDDAIEVFRPDGSGKSVTDIVNRKITFPAINTKHGLREEDESYAELFLDVFDDAYDQVTEGMRETAEEMGIEIPDYAEVGGPWEEEWITETIQEYGFEKSQEKADEYLDSAKRAMERLQENSVIDEDVKQKYQEMADFVWTRDH